MDLYFKDAVRYLSHLTPRAACPFCGSEKWILPFEDHATDKIFLMPLNAKLGDQEAYNLELECDKCGFIRAHRAQFISEWLAQNPEEDGK